VAEETPINPYTGQPYTVDVRALPTPRIGSARASRNAFTAGLSSGTDQLQSLGGSAIAATGKALGLSGVETFGSGIAARNQAEAQRSGRPELEGIPGQEGGPALTQVPSWLVYQTAKQLPQIGASLVGGAVLPRGLITKEMARAGAVTPRVLGGGGLKAGADFASRRAAMTAGTDFARTATAAGILGTPLAVGSMYEEAEAKPGGATREDAVQAFALSPVYAALDAVQPAQLGGLLKRGLAGNIVKRVATAGAIGAVSEMPQEAIQTAMELSFRPDMSAADKMKNVVNAAIVGGAVGGTLGSFGGIRRLKTETPNKIDNDALKAVIDEPLSGESTEPQRPTADQLRNNTISNIEQFGGDVEAARTALVDADIKQLIRLSEQAKGAIDRNENVETNNSILQAIEAEMANRATGQATPTQVATEPTQLTLPLEGGATTAETTAAQAQNMRQLATQIVGKTNQYIGKLQAQDEVDLLDKVLTDLESRRAPNSALKIAEYFGAIDDQGNTRDLAAEVETAGQELQAAQSATLFPEGDPAVTAAQQRFDALSRNLQIIEAVQQRRAQRKEATDAIQVGSTEGLDVRQSTQTGGGVAEGNAEGGQVAAEGEGQAQRPLTQADREFRQFQLRLKAQQDRYRGETENNAEPAPIYEVKAVGKPVASQNDTPGYIPIRLNDGTEVQLFSRTEQVEGKGNKANQTVPKTTWYLRDPTYAEGERPVYNAETTPARSRPQAIREAVNAVNSTRNAEYARLGNVAEADLADKPAALQEILNRISLRDKPADIEAALEEARQTPAVVETPAPTFTPAVVTRGAPRRQVVIETPIEPTRGAMRTETAQAITSRKQEILRAIDDAYEAGRNGDSAGITGPERLRLANMVRDPKNYKRIQEYLGSKVRYSEGRSGTGIDPQPLAERISQITSKWRANRDVTVVGSFSELPLEVQLRLVADRTADARGVIMPNGEIYILAHNLSSTDEGVAVLYHENLGHLGLAGMFRKRLDAVLTQLYQRNAALKEATNQWRANNPGAYRTDSNPLARAVEEVLAQQSEMGQIEASVFAKLKALVKLMAARLGWRTNLSDGDIRAILAMAHNRAILGSYGERAIRGARYMFAGEKALMADQNQLAKAIAMDATGASARPGGEIQEQTGWFKGFDGKWRFELSDRGAALTQAWENMPVSKLKKDFLTLDQVLQHPTLFQQYPQLASVRVFKLPLGLGKHGSFNETENRLIISSGSNEQLATTLHEIQHAIQGMEGFARGGSRVSALRNATRAQLERMRDDAISDRSDAVAKAVGRINFLEWLQSSPLVKEYKKAYDAEQAVWADQGSSTLWTSERRREWTQLKSRAYTLKQDIYERLTNNRDIFAADNETQNMILAGMAYVQDGTLKAQIGKARQDRYVLAESIRPMMDAKTDEQLREVIRAAGRDFKAYESLAGEIEAREVEARMRMTEEEARQTAAFQNTGIAPEDVILSQTVGVSARDTPGDVNQRMQAVSTAGTQLFNNIDKRKSITNWLQRALLGWSSVTHMGSRYRSLFRNGNVNGLTDYITAEDERAAINARLSQLYTNLEIRFQQLERTNPKLAEKIGLLMSATEFEIDPRKTWAEHGHLQDGPNAAALEREVNKANQTYRELKRAGYDSLYDDFAATNEATHYAMMSVSLYNMVISDPLVRADSLPEFDTNPMDQFREQSAIHEKPENARDYWRGVLDVQRAAVERYLAIENAVIADPRVSTKDRAEIEGKISPLKRRMSSISQSINAMEQSPYFHLGRFGDYFVAFSVRKNADGGVDMDAMDRVARALEAVGITSVRISSDATDKRNVFMRFETIEQQEIAKKAVMAMQRAGLLDTSKKATPKAGNIRNEEDVLQMDQPLWLDRYIQTLQASDAFEPDVRAKMVANAREVWLDMLPDTALSKVMVNRESVPGYNKDMIRNFAHRMRVGAVALSNLATASKITQAFTEMREVVQDSKKINSPRHKNNLTIQNIFGELSKRVSERADNMENPVIDRLVAFNHAYFLGMSPSYVLVNLTQIGVLLWPELTKQKGVGFVDAAKAIAKVTPVAFDIMKATMQEGAKLGPKRAADAIITEDALKRAGVSEATAKFVMDMVNTGTIDIGNASRELGRAAEGRSDNKVDLTLRYASAAGYYSETFSRLVAALSAREVYKGSPADLKNYAKDVVTESMLNYSSWNRGRMTGKTGILGPMTPVVLAFMTYQFQVIEKLYREMYTAFSANASANEKQAARSFLKGHMTAMVMLAGSLGLPMASLVARAIEGMKDLWDEDDEPYDARASWRNFLADIFGKDAAEMAARGVIPRALGFDISQRVGEADIIPFSKLLTDRRKWEDATKDYAQNALGAPFSMISNIVSGGASMMDGDVVGGMQQLVPVAFKGPVAAWRMAEDGRYVNADGQPLPIATPTATAILQQALGFVPAPKAEYQEAQLAQTVRKGQIMQEASIIRRRFINALETGDRTEQREWLQRMREFDQANPAYAVEPRIMSVAAQRQRKQTQAMQAQAPLAANPRDIRAPQLTRFANIDYAAQ